MPSVPADLPYLRHQVLNLRVTAFALVAVASTTVAVWSKSESAIILAILSSAVLAFSVIFRKSVGGRLELSLAIDTGAAATLWWLFGPVAAVDFLLFYVVAAAAFLLPRAMAVRMTSSLLLIALVQLVLHLPGIDSALPFFHGDHGRGATQEIVFRAILIVGSAVMFLTIAGVIRRSEKATTESERRFHNLVEVSPDAILVHDDTAILFANRNAADLMGVLSVDDLLGVPLGQFVHADSKSLIDSRIAGVLQGQKAARAEVKLVRPDGAVIQAEHVAIPTTFQGKPAGHVILRDITERYLAHQALSESEERYKSLFEGNPTPLYRTTPNGNILDANAALVSLLGYPDKAALLDLEVNNFYVRSSDRTTGQEILHRQGSLEDHEQELIRGDGSLIWVRDTCRIVTDSDGTVLYYEGALVDVTERKRAEDTTRRVIRILEATPDFVAIADESGHFLYANQAARDFTGIGDDAAVRELKVRDILGNEEEETLAEIKRVDIWNGVLTLRAPDGSIVPASTVVINHRDTDGNSEYFSVVARDISARIAAEARLEQLVRSKDDFVASVSHELRTPLTAVVGLTHELRDAKDRFTAEETSELISLIADQSTEVANIVEDLLVAARADIGKIAISSRETNIGEQVTAVLTALGMNDNAGISFSATDDICALADAPRVRQIIRNLLTNATRYGGDGIDLTVHRSNGSVLVTVTDDGPGVPEERRESIFEPYQRAHAATAHPASVGLGLTVSRQLARLMDGDLIYRFGPGGSSFELSLPALAE